MMAETEAVDPYEAVLADLRAKRDNIDTLIQALGAFRAVGMPLGLVAGTPAPAASVADAEPVDASGVFLGMSIVDASKKLLAARKRAMPNAEILNELRAGGLVLTGADPVNVVSSVLTRRFNNVGDVVRVSRGIWGLKEWYPGRNFKSAVKTVVTDVADPSREMTAEQKAIMAANLAKLRENEAEDDDPFAGLG